MRAFGVHYRLTTLVIFVIGALSGGEAAETLTTAWARVALP